MNAYQIGNTFNTIELSTKVKLHPRQMTYDYKEHLRHNLEQKVVGRCNNDGMITNVIKLLEHKSNLVVREDFSGASEFDVTYLSLVCVPIINTVSVLIIESIFYDYNDFLIRASNGFVTCVLAVLSNSGTLRVDNGEIFIKGRDKALKNGDFVKVFIINKRIEAGDTSMGIIGNLIDIATTEEISLYYQGSMKPKISEHIETNVQFNEDDDYSNV